MRRPRIEDHPRSLPAPTPYVVLSGTRYMIAWAVILMVRSAVDGSTVTYRALQVPCPCAPASYIAAVEIYVCMALLQATRCSVMIVLPFERCLSTLIITSDLLNAFGTSKAKMRRIDKIVNIVTAALATPTERREAAAAHGCWGREWKSLCPGTRAIQWFGRSWHDSVHVLLRAHSSIFIYGCHIIRATGSSGIRS